MNAITPAATVVGAVLALADQGTPSFPCSPADKSPLCRGGHTSATTDQAVLLEWWTQWPDAWIGVPTGEASGLDALDVDPRHGGDAWFTEHANEFPPTRTHRTPGSGHHYFFKHVSGVRNSAGRIAPGIDVRGEGGYVIFSPSPGYHVENDCEVAAWPDRLLLASVRSAEAPATRTLDDIAPPSLEAVTGLLARMPNPLTAPRDVWTDTGLAAAGCAHALGTPEAFDAIGAAWVAWSQRWAQAAPEGDDLAKWANDFSQRTTPLAGWQSLIRGARSLGVDVSAEMRDQAAAEFTSEEAPAEGAEPLTLDRDAPLASARKMIQRCYTRSGCRILHHQSATFHGWTGTHYRETAEEEMRAAAYRFLEGARYLGKQAVEPFNPNRDRVANVIQALAAVAQLPARVQAPAWLADGSDQPPAEEILACRNGLLHLPTRRLLPHTPQFFTPTAVPFDFDPHAPEPAEWLKFTGTIWPDDQQSVDTLAEVFGLLLTSDTRHQKIVLVVGPRRSGKGTIARVLTATLGRDNVCNPTLAGLGSNFGLMPLIGKPLALISDARLGGRTDPHVVAERLLSISGEDGLSIDRKFMPAWTGKLPTRFMVLTNELPRLTDASGALAGRFIALQLAQSFYGREDLGLTERLLRELPGILNWALVGLDRLAARGHFVQPASGQQAIEEMEDLASPIGAFVKQRCTIGPERSVDCRALFDAWAAWCREQNREAVGTWQTFARDLHAALPALATRRPRTSDGNRRREFQGVGLSPDDDKGDDFAALM